MTATIPLIDGIRDNTEHAKANSGQLQLPPTFDKKKYAAKWVEEGVHVEQATQPQILTPSRVADGWQVWKHAGKTCRRALGKARYVLMFRPKALQVAINAIFGNLSREKIVQEHSGQTRQKPEDENFSDAGMLSSAILDKIENPNGQVESLALQFNQIQPLSEASAARAKSKTK